MMLLTKALLLGCILVFYSTQAQELCDLCATSEPCFGSGPCADCGASPDTCTGICEGCGSAGPCRPCFEEDQQEEVFPWPVQVPEIPCDYALDKVEVSLVRGEVPEWLTGTFYHAQHTNSSYMRYDGNLANPSGILAITFLAGNAVASYATAQGSGWQAVCQAPQTPPFIQDCVVTVNQFGTPGTIASVCASGNVATFVTDDSGGVSFDGNLEFTWQDDSMDDTWPYGRECDGFCPKNNQPEHMPIDANGDVYSLYYTKDEPAAGYRIFKLPRGSTERVEVAWVPTVRPVPSYTHMGPVPTANYVILIEPPMPHDDNYDWEGYYKSFNPEDPVTVYVMDKNDGELIAQYTITDSFWTWHVANAWEDCDSSDVIVDITHDPNANTFQSFYNSTPGDFGESGLARLTLPNPRTAGLSAMATKTLLDTANLAVEFPVTQDQYQFAGPTGHYWVAGSTKESASDKAYPLAMVALVKYNVQSGMVDAVYEPENGLSLGEPFFVPKAQDQGPMNDEGAIVAVGINATGNMFGVVLDASDMTELALFEIPMAPVPNFGLHSYYSTVSSWVATPTGCDNDEGPAATATPTPGPTTSGATRIVAKAIAAFAVIPSVILLALSLS